MSASDIFVQVTATPMDSNSGQPIANPRTVMVKVPGHRINIHRERHREESADATGGQARRVSGKRRCTPPLGKARVFRDWYD